jgi:hypothetical protein
MDPFDMDSSEKRGPRVVAEEGSRSPWLGALGFNRTVFSRREKDSPGNGLQTGTETAERRSVG